LLVSNVKAEEKFGSADMRFTEADVVVADYVADKAKDRFAITAAAPSETIGAVKAVAAQLATDLWTEMN
jgi:hypothetical protein